jgi:hypothetical protein
MYEGHIISHGRQLLKERRHPIWLRYIEPVVSAFAYFLFLCFLGVAIGALLSVGFWGSVWVLAHFI